LRLADQVLQEPCRPRREVLPVADIGGGVEIGEMGGEPIDEENLLSGLGMGAHNRMLGVGILRLEREAFLDRHRGAECRLDAVARAQAGDLALNVLG
jgi:hypothetical protein